MRNRYINVGTFTNQLDLSLGISLRLRMAEADENIRYYYFLVELTQQTTELEHTVTHTYIHSMHIYM